MLRRFIVACEHVHEALMIMNEAIQYILQI